MGWGGVSFHGSQHSSHLKSFLMELHDRNQLGALTGLVLFQQPEKLQGGFSLVH